MSGAAKRAFLFRAFHPYGVQACGAVGMPPSSNDVDVAEYDDATTKLQAMPEHLFEAVTEHARWVVDVLNSEDWITPVDIGGEIGCGKVTCPDCGEENDAITLQELLIRFYISLRLEEIDGQLVR